MSHEISGFRPSSFTFCMATSFMDEPSTVRTLSYLEPNQGQDPSLTDPPKEINEKTNFVNQPSPLKLIHRITLIHTITEKNPKEFSSKKENRIDRKIFMYSQTK